jgi:hypothetical protein
VVSGDTHLGESVLVWLPNSQLGQQDGSRIGTARHQQPEFPRRDWVLNVK